MKTTILKTVMTLIVLGSSLTALADAPGPGGGPRNPSPLRGEPGDAPIDGALLWLVVLGVAFGVYMIARKRQQVRS